MRTALAIMCALAAASPGTALDRGVAALTDFRAEDAVQLLEQAREAGPYSRPDYIRLYEHLGIAYAYVERTDDALAAFDTLLALDPGRAISYTLSPKVTFLFEQARSKAADRPPPAFDVRWPLDLTVSDPIPLDVEVVADPKAFLRRAKIHYRLRGAPSWEMSELSLGGAGVAERLELPAAAPASAQGQVVEVYAVAFDDRQNEVHQWGSATRPREIALRYEPPDPWYSKWWIWAVAGTVVAAGASAAVFAATHEPGPTVGGVLEVVP